MSAPVVQVLRKNQPPPYPTLNAGNVDESLRNFKLLRLKLHPGARKFGDALSAFAESIRTYFLSATASGSPRPDATTRLNQTLKAASDALAGLMANPEVAKALRLPTDP